MDSTVAEQGKDKEIPHADTSDIIGKSRFKMASTRTTAAIPTQEADVYKRQICDFSFSVRPNRDCMESNLFMYFRWSRSILQSELLMMLSLTTGEETVSYTHLAMGICLIFSMSVRSMRRVS